MGSINGNKSLRNCMKITQFKKYSELQNNADNIGTVIWIPNLKKVHGLKFKTSSFYKTLRRTRVKGNGQ